MTGSSSSLSFFPASLASLLQRYSAGDSVFVSPGRALLTSGVALERSVKGHASVPTTAAQLLREAGAQGWRRALLIGAIPFQPQGAARLIVPRYAELMPQLAPAVASINATSTIATSNTKIACRTTGMSPTPEHYRQMVDAALQCIARGDFEKVVLSRSISINAKVDLAAVLATLAERNRHGYTFAIDQGAHTGNHTLIGASPELLLSKNGARVASNPLAGSIARTHDEDENRRRAEALLQSKKDRHEHALVVNAIAATLAPLCRELHVPATPSVLSTPTMLHLSSPIRGELRDPRQSSLELALALHPTPAVCGHPTAAARDFITRHEGFDRTLFSGVVGWCDSEGNGEWAVTIRCADVKDNDITLYAGAGIVAGSDPAAELAETSAKLRTMLNALGVDAVMGAMS